METISAILGWCGSLWLRELCVVLNGGAAWLLWYFTWEMLIAVGDVTRDSEDEYR